MVDTKRKLQELLNKAEKESKKKGLTVKCKKAKCIVVCKKDSPRFKLWTADHGIVIIDNGKCDTVIQRQNE